MAEPGCSWCKERAVATCAGEAEEGSRAVTASTPSQLGTQGLLQRRLHSAPGKPARLGGGFSPGALLLSPTPNKSRLTLGTQGGGVLPS